MAIPDLPVQIADEIVDDDIQPITSNQLNLQQNLPLIQAILLLLTILQDLWTPITFIQRNLTIRYRDAIQCK